MSPQGHCESIIVVVLDSYLMQVDYCISVLSTIIFIKSIKITSTLFLLIAQLLGNAFIFNKIFHNCINLSFMLIAYR